MEVAAIFDGATGRLNLEPETETGEPSDQVLRRGDTPAEPPGRQTGGKGYVLWKHVPREGRP